MDNVGVPLAGAIRTLRSELLSAMRQGEAEELRFGLGPVELELGFEVSTEGGGEAGIKFWLVSVGGSGKRASSTAHTVKLVLEPIAPPGKQQVEIADVTPDKPGEVDR